MAKRWKVMADPLKAGLHPNHACRFIATEGAKVIDDESGEVVNGEIIAKLTDTADIANNASLMAAAPQLAEFAAEFVSGYVGGPRWKCVQCKERNGRHLPDCWIGKMREKARDILGRHGLAAMLRR